ncbi:uncharacterized protein JCM6883_005054 [Sporobolomyces salmoneus]|uniref:uncharacterized protein n=1 Tax=Sporobolomyces salmoneus TaxID=183962 RepID=UPI0031779348
MTPAMHVVTAKPRRGRKQDDSLPPSRARDVQRAFRARRAAHLANLEAKNSWLEAENSELRKRLGMGEDDPPISGPEPELLTVASPGGSSKSEEHLVKAEEETSPPLFNWDEHNLAGTDKETGKEGDAEGHEPQEVQSWNARRLSAVSSTNSLGFEFSQRGGGWGEDGQVRTDGREQGSPVHQTQQLRPDAQFQLLPPSHQQIYSSNPLAYLANLPLGNYLPPPQHLNSTQFNYEPYPFSWPPPQHQPQAQAQAPY